MKKLIILALIILTAAITTAQAGSLVMRIAQAEAPKSEPAAAPAAPAEVKPAAEAPKAEPAAKPAAAEAPKAAAAKRVSEKQDHKEYAKMEVKECNSCHKGSGVALTHDSDWLGGHRLLAVKPNQNCKDCHDQSFCLDCHTGGGINARLDTEQPNKNTAPNTHRTDWLEIHPIKALDNPQTCTRCHQAKFCSTCHAKFRGEDLMVLSHRRSWSDSRPSALSGTHGSFPTSACQTCHPNGLLPQHVWSADHAREARRNLQSCQTCHSDGQICQTCHSARTGLRINPHPRNWDSVKDKYKNKSNGRTCIKCHDTY